MRNEPYVTQLVQIALHELGYAKIIVDGLWGPKTQEAYDDYEKKNGKVLGSIDRPWHRVLATHEEAQQLARGPWLGDNFPGVALPCRDALGRWIDIVYNDKTTRAQVVDVGPFCTDDNDYVFGTEKPRAETLKGQHIATTKTGSRLATVPDGKGGMREVPTSNGAGIDIFDYVAKQLGIGLNENVIVAWRFSAEEKWPYQFA